MHYKSKQLRSATESLHNAIFVSGKRVYYPNFVLYELFIRYLVERKCIHLHFTCYARSWTVLKSHVSGIHAKGDHAN